MENVHDPVITKEGDTYYVFCTGGGRGGQGVIPIRTSKDLRSWSIAGYVFDNLQIGHSGNPRGRGAWAPDISVYNCKYHFYYAVSSFGSRDSAIGLATNQTLNAKSPKYRWVDEGKVLRSHQDKDDWNAIDPNLFIEDKRERLADMGKLLGRHQDAPHRPGNREALHACCPASVPAPE